MDGNVALARMPQTAKARGKIAPAKFAHVVLKTPPERVTLMLDWYKAVLEGEAMYETDGMGFICYDTEHHRVAVIGFPGTKEHVDGLAGLHHMAFTYANLTDLAHTYNRLKGEGITPEYSINHGPTTSMYFFDPDKNMVELQVDNVPEEKFAEYFENGEFTANPIGVKFDPDELFGRLAAGESEESLLPRPPGDAPPLDEFPQN
ncbi:MAG: catechol 2,3-dioxygenase-like lactoylglutathione lyase family enzyme [Alphaproteobacteria bacterium]|jgi:catechol 2,3-dioxygenase-like lactoylglutathione lyase family enzyme